jgi:hypothetical protein
MNSTDKKIVETVANLWIEMGGDAEGIYWLVDEINEAIKAALANEALERKAENARELGLDYEPLEAKDEPWEKFCDSNCVWTDHHPDCKLEKNT